jgi:ketosteroid isomerase-like protein
MKTPREVSESYWAAECGRDLDAVMAHYGEDGSYEGPDGLRQNNAAIRSMYAEHMRLYPGLEVHITREFSDGDWAALEFDAVLVDPDNISYRVRGVNVVHVRDDKFVSVRSYEDAPTRI